MTSSASPSGSHGDAPSATATPTDVSCLLAEWRGGDAEAASRLMPLVYDELRRLSRRYLRRERPDHTLEPTALVHEAFLRMVGKEHPQWQDRAHFFAVAAQQMRRILVDHARAHGADKRGGDAVRVPLDDDMAFQHKPAADLLALDGALDALASLDPRKAKVVELRYFAGMTLGEVASLLDLSIATINNESRLARAWLHRHLRGGGRNS